MPEALSREVSAVRPAPGDVSPTGSAAGSVIGSAADSVGGPVIGSVAGSVSASVIGSVVVRFGGSLCGFMARRSRGPPLRRDPCG